MQVAEEAVQRHAGDQSVNWLDHGTEHPHRIALSVHVHSLQDCLAHLRHGFQQHAVQVRLLSFTSHWLPLPPPAHRGSFDKDTTMNIGVQGKPLRSVAAILPVMLCGIHHCASCLNFSVKKLERLFMQKPS